MKRMSARQEILFKEEESHAFYFKLLGILEYWGGEFAVEEAESVQ